MTIGGRLKRNGPRALRAGFLAFAMAQLLVSVAATPWLSTHSEIAHAHPLGTGDHVHALGDLFLTGPVAAAVQRVDVDLGATAVAVVRPAPEFLAAPPSGVHGARAPPAAAA